MTFFSVVYELKSIN